MLPVITLEQNAPECAIREAIVSSYRAHFAHSFRTNNSIWNICAKRSLFLSTGLCTLFVGIKFEIAKISTLCSDYMGAVNGHSHKASMCYIAANSMERCD